MRIIDRNLLQEQIINHLKDNKYILVESGPGIGRNTIIKEILKESGQKFMEITPITDVTIDDVTEHIGNMQKTLEVDVLFVNDFDKKQINSVIDASKNVNIPVIMSSSINYLSGINQKQNLKITTFKNIYEIKKYFDEKNTINVQEKISNVRHSNDKKLKNITI